jgi:hypothetical protein
VGYTTINLGLQLTIPTSGTRNWGQNLLTGTWNKISEHDHSGGGKGLQIPTAGLADDSVTTAKLSPNFGVTVASTLTPAGTTQTIDFNNGIIQVLDLGAASGNVAVTLSNPQQGGIYKIFVIQAAVAKEITWPGTVKWPQAQSPILSTTNDTVDCITLIYVGGVYYGDWQVDFS